MQICPQIGRFAFGDTNNWESQTWLIGPFGWLFTDRRSSVPIDRRRPVGRLAINRQELLIHQANYRGLWILIAFLFKSLKQLDFSSMFANNSISVLLRQDLPSLRSSRILSGTQLGRCLFKTGVALARHCTTPIWPPYELLTDRWSFESSTIWPNGNLFAFESLELGKPETLQALKRFENGFQIKN